MSREANGTTVISELIVDQAARHGLIQRVRDLGLPLVSVVRLGPDGAGEPKTLGVDADVMSAHPHT